MGLSYSQEENVTNRRTLQISKAMIASLALTATSALANEGEKQAEEAFDVMALI